MMIFDDTMVLIIFGMGVILYGISTLTAIIIEGELSGILRKKKMIKKIQSLSSHYIVCGGGETGRPVLIELSKNNEQVVLIESNQKIIETCQAVLKELLFITGDATDDEKLVQAGITKASGIIISLPSDKDVLYTTMAARMLNPEIRIISRMTRPELESKLYKAGANGVVSPNSIGALRLASEMLRPTVVNFLDSMLRTEQGNLRINQIRIAEESKFAGKTIQAIGLKEEFKLMVLGMKKTHQEIKFDPDPSTILKPGTILIVMGDVNQYSKARKWVERPR